MKRRRQATKSGARKRSAKLQGMIAEHFDLSSQYGARWRAVNQLVDMAFPPSKLPNPKATLRRNELLEASGAESIGRRIDVLHEAISAQIDAMQLASPATTGDLYDRTLAMLYEGKPHSYMHDGKLEMHEDEDGGACRALFDAAVVVAGLSDFVAKIEADLRKAAQEGGAS